MTRIRTIVLVICLFLPAVLPAAIESDALLARLVRQGQVSDFAGVFSEVARTNLEAVLAAHRARGGADIAVVALPTLEGGEVDDFTHKLFNRWGVGEKDKNNGIMLLAAIKDRKVRIEVGYGLEARLTDAQTGRLLDEFVLPHFKQEHYGEGLAAGALRMTILLSDKHVEEPVPAEKTSGNLVPLIFIAIFLVPVIIGIIASKKGGGGRWSSGGGSSGGSSSSGSSSSGGGSSGGGGASRSW